MSFWAKVLQNVSLETQCCKLGYAQDGVADEKHQQAQREQSQAADVEHSTLVPYVAVARLFVGWVGLVQIVVLLNIFGEQQEASRGRYVVLFRDSLSVEIRIVIATGSGWSP